MLQTPTGVGAQAAGAPRAALASEAPQCLCAALPASGVPARSQACGSTKTWCTHRACASLTRLKKPCNTKYTLGMDQHRRAGKENEMSTTATVVEFVRGT